MGKTISSSLICLFALESISLKLTIAIFSRFSVVRLYSRSSISLLIWKSSSMFDSLSGASPSSDSSSKSLLGSGAAVWFEMKSSL